MERSINRSAHDFPMTAIIGNIGIRSVAGLQIPTFPTAGLQIRPNRMYDFSAHILLDCCLRGNGSGEMVDERMQAKALAIVADIIKAPKVRKNTDGGVNPRDKAKEQSEAPRGDRICSLLENFLLSSLSPLSGLNFVDSPVPGACAPVCGLSHLRCLFTGHSSYCHSLQHRCRPCGKRRSGAFHLPQGATWLGGFVAPSCRSNCSYM